MNQLERIVQIISGCLNKALEWGTALLVAVMLVVIVVQAANRYFDLMVFNAFDQIARLAMVWVAFMALIAVFARRTNVRVDLFDAVIGPNLCRWRDLASDLLGAVLMTVVHVKSWLLLEIGADMPITGTPITVAWSYMALTAGSLALAMLLGGRFLVSLCRPRKLAEGSMLQKGVE